MMWTGKLTKKKNNNVSKLIVDSLFKVEIGYIFLNINFLTMFFF